MKPVRLEFKGLNSFSERAVIDFEPLLKSGIFGIFGETGSGKSTILDAINFALYGDIERNPDKLDKINYKCDELEVSFTFDIQTEGARKSYLVERSIKRKSGTHKAMLYEYSDGKSVAIADNVKSVTDKITEIIGINKEDFRKCIALPQGEFAQFVNSLPSERIQLIERLFNLQKYGAALKAKINDRESKAQTRADTLFGSLSVYERDTEEALAQLKERNAQLAALCEEYKTKSAEAAEKYSALKELAEKARACADARARLAALKERKPRYDELARVLPILSYCERVSKYTSEAENFSKELEAKRIKCGELAAHSAELSARLGEEQKKLDECVAAGEAEKLSKAESAMAGLLPVCKTLDDRKREREACRESYRTGSKSLVAKQRECDGIVKALAEAQGALAAMPEPDIDEYFKKHLKGGILREEYARTLDYIKDLQAEIRTFNDNSALYDYLSGELARKAEEYKQLILSVKDARFDVNRGLAEFQATLKKRREAETAVTRLEGTKKTCSSELQAICEKLEEIRGRGEKLSGEISELEEQLAKVFGEGVADYRAAYGEVARKARLATEKQCVLAEGVEKLKKELSQNAAATAASQAEVQSLESQLKRAEQAAAENLANSKLHSVQKCRELLKKYNSYGAAIEEYGAFTAEYAAAESLVASFGDMQAVPATVEGELEAALATKNQVERLYRDTADEYAVSQKSSADMEVRLKEKAALEKQYRQIKHSLDLIGKLKSLIRDNKFMEYIANEHLVNISRLASRTLIELTDGRYFLSYTDNNFCVGDNYNGGELRKVKTLSGGETFLVSLSLALALSHTICSRSMKSIEFFFLDEGFGTLDADLIDTVLGALEKLKNENFSIGLISHVEELKHRISSKIIVSKATESHGSSISISC